MDIEVDQPIDGQLPAPPHTEPMYDLNGNVPEPGMGVGAGTGAGDGRGMHSNHSQDSSGRGTSLSSSDASSGQQSEVSTGNYRILNTNLTLMKQYCLRVNFL